MQLQPKTDKAVDMLKKDSNKKLSTGFKGTTDVAGNHRDVDFCDVAKAKKVVNGKPNNIKNTFLHKALAGSDLLSRIAGNCCECHIITQN